MSRCSCPRGRYSDLRQAWRQEFRAVSSSRQRAHRTRDCAHAAHATRQSAPRAVPISQSWARPNSRVTKCHLNYATANYVFVSRPNRSFENSLQILENRIGSSP